MPLLRVIDRVDIPYWMERSGRRWAAEADRRLRFGRVNRVMGHRVPLMILRPDKTRCVFFFETGHQRDYFIEQFHEEYSARAA